MYFIKLNSSRSDRATSEQVLDPRTRMILFKLLNNNVLTSIDGCISTGKEVKVIKYSEELIVFPGKRLLRL